MPNLDFIIHRRPLIKLAISSVLLTASLALFHAMLVSILLGLGLVDAAESISFNNPEIAVTQANRYRTKAVTIIKDKSVLTEKGFGFKSPKDQLLVEQFFRTSLKYWKQAIKQRPLWPYYQLGALDIERFLSADEAVKSRISQIILMAPNERGLDRGLLELAFLSWPVVSDNDKKWLLTRLSQVNTSILNRVFLTAKQAGNHRDICAHLPWKKVRSLCK